MTIGVVCVEDGESSLVKVTVPEGGVAEGLTLGVPVSLPRQRWPTGRPPSTEALQHDSTHGPIHVGLVCAAPGGTAHRAGPPGAAMCPTVATRTGRGVAA